MKKTILKNIPKLEFIKDTCNGGFATLTEQQLVKLKGGANAACNNSKDCTKSGDNNGCTNNGTCYISPVTGGGNF